MIITARLMLRPPVADDLPWIHRHMNTPGVMRNLGGVRSLEKVTEGLDADIAAFAGGGYRRWTVWLVGENHRIGRCGLFRIKTEAAPDDLRGQHEIGWSLAEAFWGKGYASEAARAVLEFGFASLGLSVIYAQTSDSNRGSTRLMERLGFVRTATLDYVDPDYPAADNPTTVWRMARDGWKAARP